MLDAPKDIPELSFSRETTLSQPEELCQVMGCAHLGSDWEAPLLVKITLHP